MHAFVGMTTFLRLTLQYTIIAYAPVVFNEKLPVARLYTDVDRGILKSEEDRIA
jgi:hypothetical protein